MHSSLCWIRDDRSCPLYFPSEPNVDCKVLAAYLLWEACCADTESNNFLNNLYECEKISPSHMKNDNFKWLYNQYCASYR